MKKRTESSERERGEGPHLNL